MAAAAAFFYQATAVDAGTAVKKAEKVLALKQGPVAPDFRLKSLDGKEIRLSDYKGRVVILDFWATWCPPCKAEIPSFIEMHGELAEEGLVVIGAAADDPRKVRKFAAEYGINYPIVIADAALANDYGGIMGLPTTFVIDREGRIARTYVGFRPKSVFVEDFKNLSGI